MFFGTKIMPSIECSIIIMIIDQYYENNHHYTIIMQQCKCVKGFDDFLSALC